MTQRAGAAGPNTSSRPLAGRVASGFSWQAGQTVASKIFNVCGTIVLGWKLGLEEFGQVALAYTVFVILNQIQHRASGFEMLVQRYSKFSVWSSPALWMSASTGLVTSLLVLAAAPLAALVYGRPELTGIVAVLAITPAIQALDTVPRARVDAQMRFRLLATVDFICSTGTMIATVVLALCDKGAYSFVIPIPAFAAFKTGVLWVATKPRIQRRLHLSRWPYLACTNVKVLGAFAALTLINQGDFIALGLFHDVGLYYFAFRLSTQTAAVLSLNLAQVLLPSLSQMRRDPARQGQAFIRASRQLAIFSFGLCFTLTAVAEPLVHLAFPERWHATVRLIQILSIAAGMRSACVPAQSMILSQGRYGLFLRFSVAFGSVFFLACLAASWLTTRWSAGPWMNADVAVAAVVTACWFVFGPWQIHLAMRPTGLPARRVFRHMSGAFASSAAAAALALAAPLLIPDGLGPVLRHVVHLVVGLAVMATACPLLIWLVDREACRDLLQTLQIVRRKAA